jgi:hypothetical protein
VKPIIEAVSREMARFQAGVSGNFAGRPPGAVNPDERRARRSELQRKRRAAQRHVAAGGGLYDCPEGLADSVKALLLRQAVDPAPESTGMKVPALKGSPEGPKPKLRGVRAVLKRCGAIDELFSSGQVNAVVKKVAELAVEGHPTAVNALIQRLWIAPKYSTQTISVPVHLTPDPTLEELAADMRKVVDMVATQELSVAEAEALLAMLQKLADLDSMRQLEEVRKDLDELRRDVRGGDKVISRTGEIVPTWGRLGG